MAHTQSKVRIALAGLLGTGLAIGVYFPAWSAVLQSRSYGYSTYSDMQVTALNPPAFVIAGQASHFNVLLNNAGPDPADGVELLAIGADGLFLFGSSGCAESRDSRLLCTLGQELNSGDVRTITISSLVSPDALGLVSFGGAVGARSNDLDLENNSFALGIPVQALANLGLTLAANSLIGFIDPLTGEARLRWTFELHNFGPSTAREVGFTVASDELPWPVTTSCTTSQGALCPNSTVVVRPGAGLRMQVTSANIPEDRRRISFSLSVFTATPESGALANVVNVTYVNRLFANGME